MNKDGFLGRGRDFHESAAVGESLEVKQNDLGSLVLDQVSQEIVFVYIQLVSHGDEFVDSNVFLHKKAQIAEAYPAALSQDGNRAKRKIFPEGPESKGQSMFQIGHPDAVGTNESDSVFSGDPGAGFFKRFPFFSHLGKSTGFNDHPFDPFAAALFQNAGDCFCRGENDGQIDLSIDLLHGAVNPLSESHPFSQTYRENLAWISKGQAILKDVLSKVTLLSGNTDDSDAFRVKELRKSTEIFHYLFFLRLSFLAFSFHPWRFLP